MAVSSKDIEALWKRYSEEGANQKISVVQFFESMAYLIMHSRNGIFRVPW